MSIFDSKGNLSRMEQTQIRRREQEILAGPGDDNYKAMLIDNLYRERGLEPGSFRKRQENEDMSSCDQTATLRGLWFQLKIIGAFLAFFLVWGPFSRHYPEAASFIHHAFLYLWYSLGDIIFRLIPDAFNYVFYKL